MREKTNCPNCGAPIIGIRCEYCGTQFFDMADIDFGKECCLRVKLHDKIFMCKAIPTNMDVEYSFHSCPEIQFRFSVLRLCDEVYFIEQELKKQ